MYNKPFTSKLSVWLSAARLRTLPLSISGILIGSATAYQEGFFDVTIFILALFTTISYQVISNFANDYGDGLKGTDNSDRIGPKRALQSGSLTKKELKNGIIVTIILALSFTFTLLYFAFGFTSWYLILFNFLGIAAIVSAVKYTIGDHAYGYRGFGDVFVFIFFGLVSVLGSYFLFHQSLSYTLFFPAIAIGSLSVGVLNLNNMRDILNDTSSSKQTLVVLIGSKRAKIYHYSCVLLALLSTIIFGLWIKNWNVYGFIFLAFIPLSLHVKKVYGIKNPIDFDPELKKLALSTFLYAVLFSVLVILV